MEKNGKDKKVTKNEEMVFFRSSSQKELLTMTEKLEDPDSYAIETFESPFDVPAEGEDYLASLLQESEIPAFSTQDEMKVIEKEDVFFTGFPENGENARFFYETEEEELIEKLEDEISLLNEQQKKAVLHTEGPLLVLAGAGSGKTKVITLRIANLILRKKIRPEHILAITFTNKAANEMKERLQKIIGVERTKRVWCGTFHSMFVRILKQYAEVLGYTQKFNIFDRSDQDAVMKKVLKELRKESAGLKTADLLNRISNHKNKLESPENVLQIESQTKSYTPNKKTPIGEIYSTYQKMLQGMGALDFDDILMLTVKLFHKKEILQRYQQKFRYILIDEYQDTNLAQYVAVQKLAALHQNLCVVGDDDQSIYSFRGANIENILNFEKDYPRCTTIKLEQNYRSVAPILKTAKAIIEGNKKRKVKEIWTANKEEKNIILIEASSHKVEGDLVAREILRLKREEGLAYKDIGILIRMNALTRNIEAELRRYSIPFVIHSGQRFYDRAVIKDMLAYLRLVLNPNDQISFERIINLPARGLGAKFQEYYTSEAKKRGLNFIEMGFYVLEDNRLGLTRPAQQGLTQFLLIMDQLYKALQNKTKLHEFIEFAQTCTGLLNFHMQRDDQQEAVKRSNIENLKEMITDAEEFDTMFRNDEWIEEQADWSDKKEDLSEDNSKGLSLHVSNKENLDIELASEDIFTQEASSFEVPLNTILEAYLDRATLYTSADQSDTSKDRVTMMTVHASKGLEFPAVFVMGLEEGIFPSSMARDKEEQIAEERRLAYVAVTRAKKYLYLSYARSRSINGKTENRIPSRFLQDIPRDILESMGDEVGYCVNKVYSTFADKVGKSPQDTFFTTTSTLRSSPSSTTSGLSNMNKNGAFRNNSWAAMKDRILQSAKQDGNYLKANEVQVGMQVQQLSYGKGEILQVEPIIGDAIVRVYFENVGEKRLLVKQAKLKKI